MRTAQIGELIQRWREDPGGTYRSWFLWEERLEKAVKYLPYGALAQNREAMARFGEGLRAVDAVARALA